MVRPDANLGQLVAILCGGGEGRGGIVLIGLNIERDGHARPIHHDLDVLVQLRCQVLLMPPHDFVGRLYEGVEGRNVKRLGVFLVTAHRPWPHQAWLGLAVLGHGYRPAIVVFILDDAGLPAVVMPKAVLEDGGSFLFELFGHFWTFVKTNKVKILLFIHTVSRGRVISEVCPLPSEERPGRPEFRVADTNGPRSAGCGSYPKLRYRSYAARRITSQEPSSKAKFNQR